MTDVESALQRLFKGGVVLVLGLVLEFGLGFLVRLVVARDLGPVDYGTVSLGISILSVGAVVTVLGLDTGIGRYLPRIEDEGEQKNIILSGFIFGLSASVIISAMLYFQSQWLVGEILHAPESVGIVRVFILGIPLASGIRLSIGTIRGMQWSLPKVLVENIALPLSRFAFILIAASIGATAFGFSLAWIASFAVAGLLVFFYLRRTPLSSDVEISRGGYRQLLWFSLPLIVTAVVMNILSDIDTFFLSHYQSTGAIGIYNAIYPLALVLNFGISAVAFIFMPILSDLHSKEHVQEMRHVYRVATRWIFLITLPVALTVILFSDLVISSTFGSEYVAGSTALTILSLGFLSHALFGMNGSALTAIGRTRLLAVDNLAVALTNIGLNYLLIPQYSYQGAAVATALSYLFMNVIHSWHLYQASGIIPLSKPTIQSGFGTVVASLASYVVVSTFVSYRPLAFICFLLLLGLAHSLSVLGLGGVQSAELDLIEDIENRTTINLSLVKRIFEWFS